MRVDADSLHLLREGRWDSLYLGRTEADGRVLVRLLHSDFPSATQVARLVNELEVTKDLASVPVRRALGLVEVRGHRGIALEYLTGESLEELSVEDLSLAERLDLAVELAQSLSTLHARGIIHRNISRASFTVDESGVRITDLGFATRFDHKKSFNVNAVEIGVSLSCISPELTGRINRTVDMRTDIYSLGAVLYEIFSGQPPFRADDALGLLHAHIAQTPAPLANVARTPKCLSDIVGKAMEKRPEDRYQSSLGLLGDLQACRSWFDDHGTLETLELVPGAADNAPRFGFSDTLFGRDEQIEQLEAAFERVSLGATEFVFVAGESGAGKTALVHELHRRVATRHGFFIQGKFDRLQRNVPYRALLQAFRQFVDVVLSEPSAEQEYWKGVILSALGEVSGVIAHLLPEIELVIGPQPVAEIATGEAAQNQLRHAFGLFVDAIATPERPLVMLLDDLQWADSASLDLIRCVASVRENSLLFVGAYRSNEVTEVHPLNDVVVDVDSHGVLGVTIEVGNLGLEDVRTLVLDAVSGPGDLLDLPELVFEKTRGNAFHVREFLKTLVHEHVIQVDESTKTWVWSADDAGALDYTENVVEVMVRSLQRLPERALRSLTIASCIGTRFDLQLLAGLVSCRPLELAADLQSALAAGMVTCDAELSLLHGSGELELSTDDGPGVQYAFSHDRVRDAAYALISADERTATHLGIGRRMRDDLSGTDLGDQLFEVANHLNASRHLIQNVEEREGCARLNLAAARKALSSAAFETALEYASLGLEFLGEQGWQDQYRLSLDLHDTLGESAWLSGNIEKTEQVVAAVVDRARTALDKVAVHESLIRAYTATLNSPGAVRVGLQILAELGVSLDAQPSRARVAAAVLGTRFRLNRRTDDELLSLPVIKDERTLAALRILVTIGIPAFTTSVNLSVLIIVESWRLTVRHGHHPHAPYVYSGVGVVLAAALRDYDAAYRCGRIAYRLVDRLSVESMRPRVTQSLQTFVNPWSRPLQDVTAELMRGYQTGLETGDIEFGGFCTTTYFQYAFALARPLAHFTDEIDAVDESLGSHATARTYNQVYKQVAFNLQNATSDPAHLGGPIFDADQALEDRKENRDTWLGFSIHSNQQVLSYLFNEPDRAREEYAAALKYIEAAEGMYNEPMLKFFGVLTDLALFSTGSAKERATTERRAARALKRFRKLAERVPASFEAKAHLVEAELRRVAGDEAAARERYDRAIDSAREHAMKSDEALACELAGRFYMTRGQPRLGEYYLRAAHYAYSQWEAHAKTRHLERCYPQIRFTGNRDGVGADVDVRSLLKAAETISSTIELEALLENLLHVVIENAGAQSASILLERRGEWEVVAHQRGDPREDPTSEEVAKPFSSRIVAQVVRSKEPVLLANAAADPNYLDDLYVRATKPASVLCLPLVTQGRLTAIVYMENNLTAGAFTGESVQLLRMLSAQGAISIENARLYVKQVELTRSYSRFVPPEFLRLMGKPEITDLALGDHIGQEAAILFSDIRNFTTLSEGMAAGENFAFVNSYFDLVSPVIRRHSGVIVKYLGDGMMAVFPNGVDMAVNAAKDYAVQVGKFNSLRAGSGESPISFGIGIHVGDVVLGTVGEPERMQSDFFSDAVNLTARLESLTKQFNVSALVSREALEKTTEWPRVRDLGSALLHGKSEPVNLFELMLTEDRDPAVNEEFARALTAYQRGGFAEAVRGFEKVLELAPTDGPASYFRHRAALFLESGAPADWEGVERLAAK